MTTREAFTDDEWTAVMLLPIQVIGAGTLADGRKLISSVREMASGAKALAELSSKYPENVILKGFQDGASGKHTIPGTENATSTQMVVDALLAEAQKSWTVLRGTATEEEAAQCREVLLGVAEAVVSATGSGALGFGGDKVSPEERTVLDRVTEILAS